MIRIGTREIGDGAPCWVIAELGINHSGDLATALRMIEAAKEAGADIVKFQKRTVELAVPRDQWDVPRETPWGGVMPYIDYKRRLEFGRAEYDAIDRHCRLFNIPWFASAWDPPSVEFLLNYDLPAIKIPSACVTDLELLQAARTTGLPVVMSTGMSTAAEVTRAVAQVTLTGEEFHYPSGSVQRRDWSRLVLLHCRSTYPAAYGELNLAAIRTLADEYPVPVGFSDHATGLWMSLCAVALGACVIERHFTLDRSSWGTDQAASVEPRGLAQLVRQIRNFEQARGDGRIGPTASEAPVRAKLRRIP